MIKHFFLKYVPEERQPWLKSCGFTLCTNQQTGDHIWVEPVVYEGPLKDVPNNQISYMLRKHTQTGQIFEADMWGLIPD